ncbi:LOW QUALITY PROTEIN: uncharacterized protein EMH_0059800 [Eimeria mitis]|uniref:Haloacid dehalogenase-like hydrolase domain-containing protein n=1 Tax=Eimeria mitis TaxID=44415 RepID=U6KBC0_9EIME|nr:LOW QUALITY PROTEIN: uncharacterized protein EMH_0059800 [Eimeria mitis]CDJ34096.1 hypothetical protein, conserved [Eimeria mitis]
MLIVHFSIDGPQHLCRLVDVQKTQFPQRDRPIRLIVVDVDGTLTTNDGIFSTKNIEGFKRAKELGIEVAFATGKDPKATEDALGYDTLEAIGYFGFPGVFVNGAYVVDRQGDIIADGPLTKIQKDRLLRSFSAHGLGNVSFGKTPPGPVLGTRDDTYTSQYRAVVSDEPRKLDEVLPHLKEEFGEEIGFARWAARAFSAYRAEFNKGTGLRQLASRLNIDCEDILALGNADNDLSMFKEAGIAVCVEDGDDIAKDAADYITVKSSEGALFAVVQEIEKLGYYPRAFQQPETAERRLHRKAGNTVQMEILKDPKGQRRLLGYRYNLLKERQIRDNLTLAFLSRHMALSQWLPPTHSAIYKERETVKPSDEGAIFAMLETKKCKEAQNGICQAGEVQGALAKLQQMMQMEMVT